MNSRYNLIASSLGSYFGVGFNTVNEQLNYDMGIEEKVFDDESQDRMDLGNAMEDGCLNYFQKKLNCVIDERNSEIKYACNGLLKCKRDGRTFIDGVETGVENKYSNSSSEAFTESFSYVLQCQAYMMAWGLDQWLLLGMLNGKPKSKLIRKDEELQKDIGTVVERVAGILMGVSSREDYPWDIVEKYSKQKDIKELTDEEMNDDDKAILHRLGELQNEIKLLKKEQDELNEYAKSHYKDSTWKDADYKYTITTQERKGDLDKDKLSIEHPTIDLDKYLKPSTSYSVLRIKEL